MSQQSPLVTVITPAYNQADYLVETIESILGQDYPNVEYIVLDDGSSDHTPEVLEGYTGRITWESHENMGEARTVNKGFSMAKGEYVMVVNADDPLLPGAISRQVAYMEAHPNVLATYPDYIEIDEQSHQLRRIPAEDYDYPYMIRRAGCVPGPGALIRQEAIRLVGGRSPLYRFVTDLDFWYRLGLHGDLSRVPEFLATHRVHDTASGVYYSPQIGLELVSYIDDFFATTSLPASIEPLRNEALSYAHFEAGKRAETYRERRRHFLRAFRLYPMNWVKYRHFRSLWILGALLLPEFIYNLMRPVLLPYKWFAMYRKSRDKNPS